VIRVFGLSFIAKEELADSHLFITVLAYQFVQLVCRRLNESGINANSSLHTLREIMSIQCRVTASVSGVLMEKRCLFVRNQSKCLFIVH
jgi:hypothetical protein